LSDEVPTFAIAPRNSVSLQPKSLHQMRTSCGSFELIGLAQEFGLLRIMGVMDSALGSRPVCAVPNIMRPCERQCKGERIAGGAG